MKNALISPNESPIYYISGWATNTPPEPIVTSIENSCRIAQISDTSFEVAPPLFWVECADNITANKYYYDKNNNEIYPIPPDAPMPN
jgi:hypothetical protein